MSDKPHIMVVEARFYEDLSDALWEGAKRALENAGATYERFSVPGALEIPAAIRLAHLSGEAGKLKKKFDGFVALGCVIRGETTHYETVCNESARGLMTLGTEWGLAIGNGILTCENDAQAWARAKVSELDKGGGAALAALSLVALRRQLGS
jgi:6,7-dimethyl-8-ribityllumazine synthase